MIDVLVGVGGFAFVAYVFYDVGGGIRDLFIYNKYKDRTAYIKDEYVNKNRQYPIRMGRVIDYQNGKFTLIINDYGLFYTQVFEKKMIEF